MFKDTTGSLKAETLSTLDLNTGESVAAIPHEKTRQGPIQKPP